VNHQRPVRTRRGNPFVLMPIGAEGGMGGERKQVEVEGSAGGRLRRVAQAS
jgi:hypothetical protein